MKKILIAGGAGYIGSLLTSKLVDRGHDVQVVDLFWFGNNLDSRVKQVKKNIIDLNIEDLRGFDAVVFLGGLSNDPMAKYSPSMNFVENSAVPSYLAFICREAGVKRFVYASTCSVYGYTDNKLMDEEEGLTFPSFPYGISKLAAEKAIMNMESENPTIWRPLVDIRDVCTAYVRAIESHLDVTGVYNISYDNYTIGRLADEIRSELLSRGKEIKLIINSVEDSRNYKVSTAKAKTELDFMARYTPRDSVSAILNNLPEDIDFNDEHYYNIRTFKELF